MRIEAQASATRPDMSVLLSASAGSGKTHVLVGRMLHLLAAGVPPEDVSASTFTEKAAANMKDRLYGLLLGAVREGQAVDALLELLPSDLPYPLVKSPEDILSELTARPESPAMGTIHSQCLNILRQFPLEAGLTPGFGVMDESEFPVRRADAVDECMDRVVSAGLLDEYRILADAGITARQVRGLIKDALGRRAHLTKTATDRGGFGDMAVRLVAESADAGGLDAQLASVREQAARLAGFLTDNRAPLEANLKLFEAYAAAVDALSEATEVAGFVDAFGKAKPFFYTAEMSYKKGSPMTLAASKAIVKSGDGSLKGKAVDAAASAFKAEHDGYYDALREAVDALAASIDGKVAGRVLAAFYRLYALAEDVYSRANRQAGLVDFDDLEIHAYMLLAGPDSVKVQERFETKVRHHLVDEFQDTGEIQWGIIRRLTGEVFAGQGMEGLAASTLFAVGDEKQSIYRFRMANHDLMNRLRDNMESNIEAGRCAFPELTHNFRSAPEVLRVVDDTFSRLFGGYAASATVRVDARGSVKLNVVGRDEEPAALADSITSARGIPVWDSKTRGFRPAGYGDMAVLLRTRSRLGAYEDALRASGVPFKVVGGVGFFLQPEVRALTGLLNYMDDPADLLSLAGALKSPLFRLSDGVLEPLFGADDPLEKLAEISPDAHRLVAGWRAMVGVCPVGRLVEEIIEEAAAHFSFGVEGGAPALMNVEKLAGLAREYDRRGGGGGGLSGFTRWVREYRENTDLPTADVELPGMEEFVSVMTVHAAKGLEFPVVFIPGMDRKPRNNSGGFIAGMGEAPENAISTRALLGDNPAYGRLKETESEEEAGEGRRLLYVAMTRAMDHLFMYTGGKPGKEGGWKPAKGSWSDSLVEAAPASLFGVAGLPGDLSAAYRYPAEPPVYEHAAPAADAPAASRTSLPDAPFGPLKAGSGLSFISPSALAHPLPDTREAVRPYPATLRGSVIHAAIESFGRTGGYDVAATAARTPGFATLTREHGAALVADVTSVMEGLMADGQIREILSPGDGKHFELPLMLMRGYELVQGYADLVAVDGDRAVVYDFKSGLTGIPDAEISAAYAPQLDAYAHAVAGAFGVSTVDVRILLVDGIRLL